MANKVTLKNVITNLENVGQAGQNNKCGRQINSYCYGVYQSRKLRENERT